MRFTEIRYTYLGKEYSVIERERDYTKGDVGYFEGVLNRIESLTDAGAKIIRVDQYRKG